MYKFILSLRYLRTRFIALASIVSVTLGVATLIVVNSVLAGFVSEMHSRLHGILSDIEMASPGLGEFHGSKAYVAQVKQILGDDFENATEVVRVPSLLQFQFNGRQMTQPVQLIGIDDETFCEVSEFKPFLQNANLQKKLSFDLQEDGYDPALGNCGWKYRRAKVEAERAEQQRFEEALGLKPVHPEILQTKNDGADGQNKRPAVNFVPIPETVPDLVEDGQPSLVNDINKLPPTAADPLAAQRLRMNPEERFDPYTNQFTGIILGFAISNRRFINQKTGKPDNIHMLRPGDDVQVTLPTAGSSPAAICQNFTIVDFFNSNMHEYDSNFAFMPLSKLQQIRGMVDPVTGMRSVSAIQLKLKPDADLDSARDKLLAAFPPQVSPFFVQSWQDQQRPLLNATNLELTILNILLFLIIAVAGFGILATFYMIVVEKTKDIGILKALGASSRGIMSIFLGYGLSLGMVGAAVGIGIGLIFVRQINDIAGLIQKITGREVFDPTIYYFNEIPTIVNAWTILWVACGAIGIAVLASVLPAIRAARLHPVDALRYE